MTDLGRLLVLTDYTFQQRYSHAALARLALQGGADLIEFRQKHAPIRHRLKAAVETAAVCAQYTRPLLIGDHIDIAMAAGAQGVHLGPNDMPLDVARQLLGEDAIIGASATSVSLAQRAEAMGASYIGFGPVNRSTSKPTSAPVQGVEGVARVCAAVSIPVFAIGGVTVDDVVPLLEAGARGVAVMSAISTAKHPEMATRAFRGAIDYFVQRSA
ncbi:MAG: thiamine phosphate synthase [Bacteroidota bacterium]